MKQEGLQFAVRGAMIHAPAAGDIEILENALIAVDNRGQISAVTSPGQPDYGYLEQNGERRGQAGGAVSGGISAARPGRHSRSCPAMAATR